MSEAYISQAISDTAELPKRYEAHIDKAIFNEVQENGIESGASVLQQIINAPLERSYISDDEADRDWDKSNKHLDYIVQYVVQKEIELIQKAFAWLKDKIKMNQKQKNVENENNKEKREKQLNSEEKEI